MSGGVEIFFVPDLNEIFFVNVHMNIHEFEKNSKTLHGVQETKKVDRQNKLSRFGKYYFLFF